MNLFNKAFAVVMESEVGPWFNDKDQDTIAGKCDTKEQRRKTGYVFDKLDMGGETKFGVSKRAHPYVNVKSLTLQEARDIYHKQYWIAAGCDKIKNEHLAIAHFDAAVNHGNGRAINMLQKILGMTERGPFGPKTTALVNSKDGNQLFNDYLNERRRFFRAIVANNPPQERFLKGWLNRIDHLEKIKGKEEQ